MIYLILSIALYTSAVLVATTASRNANTNIVALITEAASVLAPLAAVIVGVTKKTWTWDGQRYGLLMAALGGILIGIFVLTFNKALTQNKVGIVTPVIYGGSIFLSTILSYFIYKEKVSVIESIGLGLVLIGVITIIYARATAKV